MRKMTQSHRLKGGLINRQKELAFSFDGKRMSGYQGDTLASALLANGVRLMGRSFKYHRPRGVVASGSEEPNALVELREGARREPNTRATMAELYDGLLATSQNRYPSLAFDVMAINDRLANFIPAGFYYKTFMWPASFWERVYEPIIRRAAGLGRASTDPDPDDYDKAYLHCDVLIIGAGAAGLMAALAAGRAGVNLVLADEDFVQGGRLNSEQLTLDDEAGSTWAAQAVAELMTMDNVTLMMRSTVIGAFDHGIYGIVERIADHVAIPAQGQPRQRLWRIYTKSALLCSGATERPIVFDNNDRPNIMLAGAMRAYGNRWGVAAGKNIAIFANNDDAHRTARDLHRLGVRIQAVIDTRENPPVSDDFDVIPQSVITNTKGRLGVKSIIIKTPKGETSLGVDALGVSGGWNPNIHLTCHQRGRPQWDDEQAIFLPPKNLPKGLHVAGAASGHMTTSAAMKNAMDMVNPIIKDLGHKPLKIKPPKASDESSAMTPFWYVQGTTGWLDQQNDVTIKDIELAHRENFRSPEHMKRYTTLGMATDQGKTSAVNSLGVMMELTGKPMAEIGTTMYRPPYTPVAIGTFAGRSRDEHFRPTRKTPSHVWAQEQGAVFVEAGLWLRAQWFPQAGESHWRQSVDREVNTTRGSVGICDVTTLGKIDVQGGDAAEFLDRIYCNNVIGDVGRTRYGLMLREDGMAMDDGTAARLKENHFVITTTTANAVEVYRHMEFAGQVLWPDLDVQMISTTESWAQFAVAGPNSRKLLAKVVDAQFDLSNEAFPFMACGDITVCGGVKARLFRISFSGELAYEIAVPSGYGDAMIRVLMDAGKEFGVCAYGTEALGVMRIEKGHMTSNELNGTTTALNLGLQKMVSKTKDAIGIPLSRREGMTREDGLRLIGIQPCNPKSEVVAGAHLMTLGTKIDAKHDQGYVTSACHSPSLGHDIGLGFLKAGDQRHGEVIMLASPLTNLQHEVKIVSPHFIDPEGGRMRA